MSNSGSGQGIYSPLRQNITDSDSEEEIHTTTITRNQILSAEKQNKSVTMKNGLKNYHHFSNGDEIEDSNGYALSIDNTAENVSILQSEKNEERMSLVRKIFFVLSIVLCFATVIVFLWVVPCSQLGECSVSSSSKNKRPSWENPYHDIELKGAINIVDGVAGHEKNLIMLFRGDIVNPEHSQGVRLSNDNGIILIVGNSGKVGWFIRQPRLPTDVDCSLLDVDKDGIKDCIVVGKEGLFAAFNPMTGTVYWYLHNHDSNSKPFDSVSFPLVLMDMDGDDVNDMLAPCNADREKTHDLDNSLIFISGYTGGLIGQPLLITECTSINKLQIDKDHIISYTCKNNTTLSESLKVVKFEELYKSITNKPYNPNWDKWSVSKQHQIFGQRKEIENQRNVYTVDGRKLIVENQGHCPKNCKVTVQLIDERSGKENISWEYIAPRVYGMVPATLVFNSTANMLKHHISGFVLKFWQWNANPKNVNRFDRNTDNNYNIFNNIIEHHVEEEEKLENSQRLKRNAKQAIKNDNVTVVKLTERVVLVTFNSTDIHIVNASQSDVFQVCLTENKDPVCQPDLGFQENSLLIADLDGDGSQELITYLTSFVCPDSSAMDEYSSDDVKCDEEWRLHSTVRVVRLEAELPKLYEAVSHH